MKHYPRPIRDIHQIELTTRCNLKCHYCPHYPELPRPKEDMAWDIFEASLALVDYYVQQGTQTELSLTGIGESLLHPRFVEMVAAARTVIGPDRQLTVTTNGLLLDDEMCASLQPFRPSIFVSLHRPEKAALAMVAAKKYGLLAGRNTAFADSAFDWAGYQKNWKAVVSAPNIKCEYLRSGWGVILVDGRITTCCLDADGSGVVGTVQDNPDTLVLAPWGNDTKGCNACHMEVP
jgi:hypothetical protein